MMPLLPCPCNHGGRKNKVRISIVINGMIPDCSFYNLYVEARAHPRSCTIPISEPLHSFWNQNHILQRAASKTHHYLHYAIHCDSHLLDQGRGSHLHNQAIECKENSSSLFPLLVWNQEAGKILDIKEGLEEEEEEVEEEEEALCAATHPEEDGSENETCTQEKTASNQPKKSFILHYHKFTRLKLTPELII
ncbi:hypothetical protein SDJN02_10510, partial [Cucurbita argyrosperma subsp. argyrosperma]